MDWNRLREKFLGPHKKTILPPGVKLPMLPTALMEFSRESMLPNANPKHLGEIIESDAGLTCELLRYVNSSAVSVRQKVSSAQQAVVMLGARSARLYLTTSALRHAMKSCESKLINVQVFWNTNLERAIFAREIAKLMQTDAELAYAGALLQDFALPILTSAMLDDYLKFWNLEAAQRVGLAEFEQKVFGWNHAEAAARIMLSWGFPDDLICCVAGHHDSISSLVQLNPDLRRSPVSACAIAGLMPDPFQQVPDGIEQLVQLESVWSEFRVIDLARKVDAEFRAMTPASAAASHLSFLRRYEERMQLSAC